ncbi:formiminoglutamase [Rhodoglobus vestalii]|uniref:Formiminoglutamase n=1 Tax=Rhodoglobus vestalii TaxID=193384 RepID=A0A8H2KA11_9MICO|nr:agmatinase family protein [Rhodoglobus vestalii]TQO20411.1 formiminoglutamase [Rhodoglobus vestalii]
MLSSDPLWPRAGDWPSQVNDEWADVALIGMPTSRTSLSPTQAHTTPTAVREALRRYAALTDLRIVDVGNVREPDLNEQGAIDAVAGVRAELVIALGGDNAATVPTTLGRWGSNLPKAGLITLDAHYDLRDGTTNGSPVRRLLEAGLDGRRVVQIGIEPLANSLAYAQRARDAGITVITREELLTRPMADVMAQALEIAGAGGGPIHVDLDVDVCDRAIAPGCPASVPGGISALELRTAARLAGAHPAVASIDLVEVDAAADSADERTVRLVALCVLEAISGVASR